MRVAAALGLIVSVAATAHASGPELVEQSPAGVALAGAQAADSGAAAAVYYNPAALAFQAGLMAEGGGAALLERASATVNGVRSDGSAAFGVPAVFASLRVSPRYAVGIGVYEPFAWSRAWPTGFAAGLQGLGFDWRALAVNPSIAVRPRRWFALGLGIDIVPTTITLRRLVLDGNGDGERRIDSAGTGFGGNVGLLFRVLRRPATGLRVDVAVSYRSAISVGLSGRARTTALGTTTASLPPLASVTATLPTPHAFTFAAAVHALATLTLTADLRVSLWRSFSSLLFTLGNGGGATAPTVLDATLLQWRDTVGIRVGAQYGLWRDGAGDPRLVLRVGGGFEQSPAPSSPTSPLFVDGDRGLVGAGVAVRVGAFCLEASYGAAIATSRGGYSEVTHIIAAALSARWPDLPRRNDGEPHP
jgi:long-chain fatty acid transport protein